LRFCWRRSFSATWIIGGRAAVAQFGTPGGFSAQGGVDSQGEMVKAAAAFNVGKDGKGVIRITADVASGWHIYSIAQARRAAQNGN